ncbi:MAG TPA: hypothetical protein DEO30_03525 [Lactococcus sp.]|nr:hypothetical protein [Lactococcus sp.]
MKNSQAVTWQHVIFFKIRFRVPLKTAFAPAVTRRMKCFVAFELIFLALGIATRLVAAITRHKKCICYCMVRSNNDAIGKFSQKRQI